MNPNSLPPLSSNNENEGGANLRQIIGAVVRHWRLIVLIAIVAAIAAGAISFFSTRVYEATALVTVTQPRYALRLEGVNQLNTPSGPQRSYTELARSDEIALSVMNKVKETLPPEINTLDQFRGRLRVTTSTDATLVTLVVTDSDPVRAAKIANVWAEAFISSVRGLYGIDAVNLASYQKQLERSQNTLTETEQTLADFQAKNRVVILQAELNTQQSRFTDLLNRQVQINLLIQSAEDIRKRLELLDPKSPTVITNDLAVLQLSIQSFVAQQTSAPVQLQMPVGQALSGKTAAEQILVVDSILGILRARAETWKKEAAALEPLILDLQGKLAEAQIQEARLRRARDLAEGQYTRLNNKVREAEVAAQDANNLAQLASNAGIPTRAAGWNRILIVLIAAVAGAALSTTGTLAWEWWQGNLDS
ncbi:MAG: hypothetical protein HZC38_18165 [Chloroflexi bacterium]|nr:hypothetical protein [Chloroflexota bacterium]